MNKYFKYILLGIMLFFVSDMQVKANEKIVCQYYDGDNKIQIITRDNGQTWYKYDSLFQGLFGEDGSDGKPVGLDFFSTVGERNLIKDFTYPVSSMEDCPKDGEITITVTETTDKYKEYKEDIYSIGDIKEEDKQSNKNYGKSKTINLNENTYGGRDFGGGGQVIPIKPSGTGETTCQSLFEGLEDELQKIFNAIKVVVPILVIVFSSLDFAKAIFGGSEDDVKKSQVKFAKRLIVAFIFFLLPTFISFAMEIMNVIYNGGNFDCLILG